MSSLQTYPLELRALEVRIQANSGDTGLAFLDIMQEIAAARPVALDVMRPPELESPAVTTSDSGI